MTLKNKCSYNGLHVQAQQNASKYIPTIQ